MKFWIAKMRKHGKTDDDDDDIDISNESFINIKIAQLC